MQDGVIAVVATGLVAAFVAKFLPRDTSTLAVGLEEEAQVLMVAFRPVCNLPCSTPMFSMTSNLCFIVPAVVALQRWPMTPLAPIAAIHCVLLGLISTMYHAHRLVANAVGYWRIIDVFMLLSTSSLAVAFGVEHVLQHAWSSPYAKGVGLWTHALLVLALGTLHLLIRRQSGTPWLATMGTIGILIFVSAELIRNTSWSDRVAEGLVGLVLPFAIYSLQVCVALKLRNKARNGPIIKWSRPGHAVCYDAICGTFHAIAALQLVIVISLVGDTAEQTLHLNLAIAMCVSILPLLWTLGCGKKLGVSETRFTLTGLLWCITTVLVGVLWRPNGD